MKQRNKLLPLILLLVVAALLAGFLLGRAAQKESAPTSATSANTVLPVATATPAPKPAQEEPEETAPEETDREEQTESLPQEEQTESVPDERGSYTKKDEVALYIHTYGHLPDNYITKKEAEKLGWKNSEGNLWDVASGMCIGGDRFGNYEGYLPDGDYKECDVNYEGGYRGPERIVFSSEGSVYYTADHYKTFEQLY